jgi:hypothetical protein
MLRVEFIFKDEAFKFETLRAAGFARDAGADIGKASLPPRRFPRAMRTRGQLSGGRPPNAQRSAAKTR